MPALDAARSLLQARLDEIDNEANSLGAALKHLDGGNPAKGRKRAAANGSPKARRSGGRKRKSPKGQRQAEVLATIRSIPGVRASEIAKAIGANPGQVHAILKRLLKTNEIKKRNGGYHEAAAKAEAQKEPAAA